MGDTGGDGDPAVVDARGLKCPLPALKAERRLDALAAGRRLTVLATDPMAAIDIPHLCNERGDRLVASSRDGDVLRFEIEKGG